MRANRVDAAHQNIVGNLLSAHRVNRLQDASLSNQENRFIYQLQRALEESQPKVKSTPETRSGKVKERDAKGDHRPKHDEKGKTPEGESLHRESLFDEEEDQEHMVDLMV